MISFILATAGIRPTIQRTLASIECWPGDEIIVVGGKPEQVTHDPRVRHLHHEPGGDWGHTERNYAIPFARGRYLAHIDDDDEYVPGARALMAKAIAEHPDGPSIFKMQYLTGLTLWQQPVLYVGNIGTPMTLWPNTPEKMGVWGPTHEGDFHFWETMKWSPADIRWWPHVIALIG